MPNKHLFFIPFDQGADINGAHRGVRRIFENIDETLLNNCSYTYLFDPSFIETRSKNLEFFNVMYQDAYLRALTQDCKVITISGDHSITFYAYQLAVQFFGPMPLIIFDAHSDASREYEDLWLNHGCFVRELKKHLSPVEIFHVGVRYDPMKLVDIDTMSFPTFSFGPQDQQVEELITKKIGDSPCYISFDMDVVDPEESPGVNFPVSGGIQKQELFRILDKLFCLHVVAADVVEYAANRDIDSRSLDIATEVVEKWMRS